MGEALKAISLAEEELEIKGISIDIMEIKPSVSSEIVDELKGRCPPTG